MTRISLAVIASVCLVLAVLVPISWVHLGDSQGLGVKVYVPLAARNASLASVTWPLPPSGVPQADAEGIATALAGSNLAASLTPDSQAIITDGSVRERWAMVSGEIQASSSNAGTLPDQPFVSLLMKTSGSWQVLSPADPAFCERLMSFPADVISTESKAYFGDCKFSTKSIE